jgi:hypothetical protein
VGFWGEGGASSTHGTDNRNTNTYFRWKNLKEEDHFEEPCLTLDNIQTFIKDHDVYLKQIIVLKVQ